MTFGESISTCFNKYVVFEGCASRSEYWWWFLFNFLASFAAGFIEECMGFGSILSSLVSLALFLPSLAVAVRRCHDTNHSGWWILCPIYNIILMLMPTEKTYDNIAGV